MSKTKRIARSKHSDKCTYMMDGDSIIHMCEDDCEINRNGGVGAVLDAMVKVDRKKFKRQSHQRRKKRRGW